MKIFKPNHKPDTQGIISLDQRKDPKKRFVVKADGGSTRKSTINDELHYLNDGYKAKVCIYRGCGGIGDILMCTPLLQAIKETYPDCHLTFAVDTKTANDTYYNILKNNPYIDEVISAHTVNRDRYHLFKDISSSCLQYENSGLPWINRIDIFANACGFKLKNPKVYYKVEDQEREWAQAIISKVTKGNSHKIVMLHTASFDVKRTWPIHKYIELIGYLNKNRSDIFYLVNDFQGLYPYWDKVKNTYNVSAYRIRELAALTEQVDCFVGPDSGPMHIAGALEILGVTLFGSIPPQARINYYPSLEAITATGLACLGCGYHGCQFNIKCMTSLSPQMVGDRVLRIIDG